MIVAGGFDTRAAVIELGLALAIVLTAMIAWRTPIAVLPLFVLSVIWPVADQAFEGPTLLVLSHLHGVTTADLLGVASFLYGLVVVVRTLRR